MTALEKSKAIMARICGRCDSQANCVFCNLHMFDTALQYVAEGKDIEDAVTLVQKTANKELKRVRDEHDQRYLLTI